MKKPHVKAARQIHNIPTNHNADDCHLHGSIISLNGITYSLYIHKKRVAFEMFKVVTSGPERRLSSFFETYESSKRGLLMNMRHK